MLRGRVAILPYEQDQFEDRVSGVAIDALAEGSPILATADTWMSRLIDRFDCGVAVVGTRGEDWYKGAMKVLEDWDRYHRGALKAAEALATEHDPGQFWQAISRFASGNGPR